MRCSPDQRLICTSGFIKFGKDHTRQKPRYELIEPKATKGAGETDNLIWLPNPIVMGTSSGEISPIQRLRSAGDPWALRLFVDLYHAQNLRDDGGINPEVLHMKFERKKICARGIYNVWGFKRGDSWLSWTGPFAAHQRRAMQPNGNHPVWDSVAVLRKMGLLNFVPHLYENSSPQAEPIHPFGVGAQGEEPIETEMGRAADTAAQEMCQEWAINNAADEGFDHFCPVSQTKPDVQLIGVARLLYRPHTKRTAAWFGQLQVSGKQAISYYEELAMGKTLKDDEIAKRA